jgi:hypothetical protein
VKKANQGFFTVVWSECRSKWFEVRHAANDSLKMENDLALLPDRNALVVRMM